MFTKISAVVVACVGDQMIGSYDRAPGTLATSPRSKGCGGDSHGEGTCQRPPPTMNGSLPDPASATAPTVTNGTWMRVQVRPAGWWSIAWTAATRRVSESVATKDV